MSDTKNVSEVKETKQTTDKNTKNVTESNETAAKSSEKKYFKILRAIYAQGYNVPKGAYVDETFEYFGKSCVKRVRSVPKDKDGNKQKVWSLK